LSIQVAADRGDQVLASARASYVTGTMILVNGGLLRLDLK